MNLSYHYMLMVNHVILQKKLFLSLKDTGLTLGQPKVLDFLREKDGAAQKEIAAACHIEPASLTTILNGMEEKGMIQRKSLNGNRRSWHIFLTDRGKEIAAATEKRFEELEAQAFAGISGEERRSFLKTFEKIYQNMETLEGNTHDRKN